MSFTTRRQFLHHTAASAAVFAAPIIRRGPLGQDVLRVGVAGVRGRGHYLLKQFEERDNVEVVALCDVDEKVLAQRAGEHGSATGRTIRTFEDFRDMIASKEVDAVAIATPNHLHTLCSIQAMAAGKDVYVEKPVSHNLWEGRQLVAAVEKYGRVLQTGTQTRSSHAMGDAIRWLDSGAIGEKTHGWGTCFKPRPSIGKVEGAQEVPEGVNWKLYMGPRGPRPLARRQLHYDWHWQFPTGNGDLGNQGVHQVDQTRWALGMDELAPTAISIGGRFGYDDDGDTPNTLITFYDYQPAPMIFEVRGLPKNQAARKDPGQWRKAMDQRLGSGVGSVIHAEGGYLRFPNYTSARAYDRSGKEIRAWDGTDNHVQNFVDAVVKRDGKLVSASARDGHLSAGLCHMGNDSYRVGTPCSRGEIERAVASTPLLAAAFDRLVAHLDANGIDLGTTPLTFGATLAPDKTTGFYVDQDDASELAGGEYVQDFMVPKLI